MGQKTTVVLTWKEREGDSYYCLTALGVMYIARRPDGTWKGYWSADGLEAFSTLEDAQLYMQEILLQKFEVAIKERTSILRTLKKEYGRILREAVA